MSAIETIMNYPWPWLCWILPMLGAVLMPLIAKLGDKIRDYTAIIFAAMPVLSSFAMLPALWSGHTAGDITIGTWINLFGHPLEAGVLVDPLSIMICNVVAFISFLIVVYSTSYMHGDKHLTRYWFFFLFFVGSMELLVISDNLIQVLIGWEGVGMCSYGLIGYYYRDAKERWLGGPEPTKMFPPSHCGMKAFVVTGIGDVFILAAIFIIFSFAGTLNFTELIHTAEHWMPQLAANPGLLALTAVLFLGGPIGKSAQFPLHEWLPEAMAGPTSVSALIHAATMVKAGVYLVARMSPVFYIGTYVLGLPEAQTYFTVIAMVGAFTCFLAASQAMVSVELKKILAYSTVSQIGYMMLGLGLSGFSEEAYLPGLTAGVFHLISHALFKAALFLGAGSVIHAVESIYTFNLGGLKKHMPKTYWLMFIATLSLSGIPPLSGFWSKDSVFLSAIIAGTPLAYILLAVGAISAAMTLFYSIRYITVTFFGEESQYIKDMEHHGHHVHEAPALMWGPIAVLVGLVVVVGLLGLVGVLVPSLSPEIFIEEQLHHAFHNIMHGVELVVPHVETGTKLLAVGLSGVMLAIGGGLGWYFYIGKKADPGVFVSSSGLLTKVHTFLWNRWYMNPIYYLVFVDGFITLGRGMYNGLEKLVFDKITPVVSGTAIRLGINLYENFETEVLDEGLNVGIPKAATSLYHHAKKLQTGVLSYNIAYMAFIFLFLIVVFILKFGGMI